MLSCTGAKSEKDLEQRDRVVETAVISGAFMQKNKDDVEKEEAQKKKRKARQQQEPQDSPSGNQGQGDIAN